MHLIFHLYFGLSPCGYCYRHWSCCFFFLFFFSMQWPIHRNLTTRRRSLWYAVLNVERCARERCYECRPNTSTSSASRAKVSQRISVTYASVTYKTFSSCIHMIHTLYGRNVLNCHENNVTMQKISMMTKCFFFFCVCEIDMFDRFRAFGSIFIVKSSLSEMLPFWFAECFL